MDGLRDRAVAGAGWLAVLQASTRALLLLRTIVLARLLAPSDFGLFALVVVVTTMFEMLTQTGLKSALVQRQEISRPYLDSAWSFDVLRSALLASLFYFTAPSMAVFFEHSELELLLKVVSLIVLLQGLTNIGVIHFQRHLEFKKECILGVAPVILELIAAILAAVVLRSVWALVIGLFVRTASAALFSYILSPYRPTLQLAKQELMQLLSFGKWMFLFSIVVFLILNTDKIFIGKALGAEELGFYQVAVMVGALAGMEISNILNRLAFPVYAKIANDTSRTRSVMIKLFEPTALVLFPITLWLVVYAEPLVFYLFGSQWIPMTLLLQLAAIKGLIWGLAAATGGPLYLGIGRPDINFRINLVQLVLLAALIYPLAELWGAAGVALATVIAFFSSYIINIARSLEVTGLDFGSYVSVLTVPVLGCVVSMIPVMVLRAVGMEHGVVGVGVSMVLMTCTYGLWLLSRGKIAIFIEFLDVVRK